MAGQNKLPRGVRRIPTGAGDRYEVVVRNREGAQLRRRFPTIEDAENFRAHHRINKLSGLTTPARRRDARGALTISQVAAGWHGSHRYRSLSVATRRAYENHLKLRIEPTFGSSIAGQLTSLDVAEMRDRWIERGDGAVTVNQTLRTLSSMCAWAVENRMLPANPATGVRAARTPPKREIRVLTVDEIKRLESNFARWPDRIAVMLMGWAGLRMGEVFALRWADLDADRRVIRVRASLTKDGELKAPKSGRAREVEMLPFLHLNIGMDIEERRGTSGEGELVVPNSSGGYSRYSNWLRRAWAPAVDRAGLGEVVDPMSGAVVRAAVTPHHLRHSFASLCIHHGISVVALSRMLGHATPDITMRVYAHEFERSAAALSSLDSALEGTALVGAP